MLAQGSGGRIAILVRNLGALANPITDELANEDISYFNGFSRIQTQSSLNSMRLLYPGSPMQRLEKRASAGLQRAK